MVEGISFATVALVLILLYIFKRPIKTVTGFVNDNLVTEINEGSVDLTQRSMQAYEDLIQTCGEDFLTPKEVYEKMHKRQKRMPVQQSY